MAEFGGRHDRKKITGSFRTPDIRFTDRQGAEPKRDVGIPLIRKPDSEIFTQNGKVAEKTRQIVEEFNFRSNVRALYTPDDSDNQITFFPPKPESDLNDDQLLSWAQRIGVTVSDFIAADHGMTLQYLREVEARKYVGGSGITKRNMDELRVLCPPIDDAIAHEKGKIVILGNGFSSLPLHLTERQKETSFSSPPVIVDLFDFRAVQTDLLELQERLSGEGLNFPARLELARVNDIVAAMDSGIIRAMQYVVGSGNPPAEVKDADLIINTMGPHVGTADEQLSYLTQGGCLLMSYDLQDRVISSKFSLTPVLQLDNRAYTSIVVKGRPTNTGIATYIDALNR